MPADKIVDVVVVGFGGAGACAAIAAHDAGAEVLVLEKAGEGGGNTLESGGTLRRVKDGKRAVDHYEALTHHSTPRDVLEVFTQGVGDTLDWLEKILGAELVPLGAVQGYPVMPAGSAFPSFPGADALDHRLRVRARSPGEHGGKSLWDVLSAAVARRSIEVRYHAPAAKLLRDTPDGPIAGVACHGPGGTVTLRARRAVILTCGGFASNEDMHKNFIGPIGLNAFGPPGRNTGDGIKLAVGVGADLWHMNAIAGPFGYKFPEYEAAFPHRMPTPGYIYVDGDARRFLNEAEIDYHACAMAALSFDPSRATYPRIPSYVIFDETTRRAGPVGNTAAGWNRRFPWSADNAAEIRRGWIKEGATIAELATRLRLSEATLEATVGAYNEACRSGCDAAFGRKPELLVPLVAPPYYGVELWPCLLNTQGGPRRNHRAQVMSVEGAPIPRLYGAGELGSIWGMLYPGAGNVGEALVFGRLAGRNAAAETPMI